MPNETYKKLQALQQSDGVRTKLAAVRDRIAGQVEAIAAAEGVDVDVVTSEGTRPKGRAYARVGVPAAPEFGNETTPRRRFLGRAVAR